jgi:hypothetical protein
LGYEEFNPDLDRQSSHREEFPPYESSLSTESMAERILREKIEQFDWSRAFSISYFMEFFAKWDRTEVEPTTPLNDISKIIMPNSDLARLGNHTANYADRFSPVLIYNQPTIRVNMQGQRIGYNAREEK